MTIDTTRPQVKNLTTFPAVDEYQKAEKTLDAIVARLRKGFASDFGRSMRRAWDDHLYDLIQRGLLNSPQVFDHMMLAADGRAAALAAVDAFFTDAGAADPVADDLAASLVFPVYKRKDRTKIPPRDWLYGRHLIRKFVSARVAAGAVGKTALTIVDSLCMLTGKEHVGQSVRKPLNVMIWNGEDPQEELDRRFEAACLRYKIKDDDIKGTLIMVSGRDYPLKTARVTKSGDAEILVPVVEKMVEQLIHHKIDVLILDPFISTHSVNENNNDQIDLVVKEWGRVAERANCAIDLVHHVRKGNGTERTVEDGRGASSLKDATRDTQLLLKMTSDEATKMYLPEEEAWRYFRIADAKSNMAPPISSSTWFRMDSVPLGNAQGDLPEDIVGVPCLFEPTGTFEPFSKHKLSMLFAAMRGGAWRVSEKSPQWLGHFIAEHLDLEMAADHKDGKANRRRVANMIAAWLKSGAIVKDTVKDGHRHDKEVYRFGKGID